MPKKYAAVLSELAHAVSGLVGRKTADHQASAAIVPVDPWAEPDDDAYADWSKEDLLALRLLQDRVWKAAGSFYATREAADILVEETLYQIGAKLRRTGAVRIPRVAAIWTHDDGMSASALPTFAALLPRDPKE